LLKKGVIFNKKFLISIKIQKNHLKSPKITPKIQIFQKRGYLKTPISKKGRFEKPLFQKRGYLKNPYFKKGGF